MRLIIAITGASGVKIAQKFISLLPKNIEKYIILSKNAHIVFEKEENVTKLKNDDIGASVASGSFKCDAMIILPCSMNTLAKIASGISDNLTTRAAGVMIKEQKKLILAPREMPFSPIALENMLKLAKYQVLIAPPILGYYSNPISLDDMERFLIGKWFDLLEIEHNLFQRWEGK